jgi:hypothetical protein
MLPDVAQPRGAEQRVAHGMDQNIGVGMPGESFLMRDRNPTDDEFPARDECMGIKSLTYPHISTAKKTRMKNKSNRQARQGRQESTGWIKFAARHYLA